MGTRARRVAHSTPAVPPGRDLVVDLVRVLALVLVVLGHWLVRGVYVDAAGALHRQGLVGVSSWTHPLTWAFQVIPVLFVVGGYSNAASWRSGRRRGEGYGTWLHHRMLRLTGPLVPLMLFWAAAPVVAPWLGLGEDWVRAASRASLVPTWFLAVYVVIVALTPVTVALWDRFGLRTLAAGLLLAAAVDVTGLATGVREVGAANLVLVWGTLAVLGHAWRDGALDVRRGAALAVASSAVLVLLVAPGPFSVSMVGVSGFGVSNTNPPRVTLLLLGFAQAGLALAAQGPLRRLAARPWCLPAVLVLETRLMTIYLWHLAAFGLVLGAALRLGDLGLAPRTGTPDWWALRPPWLLASLVVLAGIVALLGRFEAGSAHLRPVTQAWRPLLEVAVWCVSLSLLAAWGLTAPDGTSLAWLPLVPVVATWLLRHPEARPGRRTRPAGTECPAAGDPAGAESEVS